MKTQLCVMAACALLAQVEGAHAKPNQDIAAPPPVSGRSLSNPDSVTSADVLARVRLIHDNLQLIRAFVGRSMPPQPLLRVEGAHPREVFLQSYNLLRRSRQLGFEHLRTPVEDLKPEQRDIVPALNLQLMNEVLVTVLRVKRSMGIEDAVAEKPQADNTTPTDVFNATVETGRLMDSLLDKQTGDNEVFVVTTLVFNITTELHALLTKKFVPPQPQFVANKTNADLYPVLYRCYELVRKISDAHGLEMLSFSISPEQMKTATTNNTNELAVLLIAEMLHLSRTLLKREISILPIFTRHRYPAHSLQRALHLELVLQNLLGAVAR